MMIHMGSSQLFIENIDEKVMNEIEKRKHCKNPFEDKFLNLALSAFTTDEIPSGGIHEMVEIESSIMNASVNVSIRSELIKEMIKQTVKSVDHVVAASSRKSTSKAEKKDEPSTDEYATNFDVLFNEERYRAYKEQDKEKVSKFLTLNSHIEHISTNQKLEELPIPQSFSHLNYYVLNTQNIISVDHGNETIDQDVLNEIFQGFESVLDMPEDKVEELFALEGINIYEEIEIQHNDPMEEDIQQSDTVIEESAIEFEGGGMEILVEEDIVENIQVENEPINESFVSKEIEQNAKQKEKKDMKYYRIIDMEKPLERKKTTKQTTLRTKQNAEDNLLEIKPRPQLAQNTFFTKLEDMFNHPFNEPEFNGSLLFPNIDIIQLSNILAMSIDGQVSERAMYEIGGYEDCEYEGIDDYLFGNDLNILEDRTELCEVGGQEEMQEETVEITVPRTKTIIDNLIENVEKKKIIPIVKISSIINDNLSTNQTTTLTEQYQTSQLNDQNVSKARFFMALLHTVHQTNIKGNTQITLSNVGENMEEVKIVTRNLPAKTIQTNSK